MNGYDLNGWFRRASVPLQDMTSTDTSASVSRGDDDEEEEEEEEEAGLQLRVLSADLVASVAGGGEGGAKSKVGGPNDGLIHSMATR